MNRAILLRRLRFQFLGLVFLLVCALFIATTVAIYRKAFTPAAMVVLQADRTGNQLSDGSDVKIRGVRVGEVRSIQTRGEHASISLALDPARVSQIPANVNARLLPKTLFGERYVALRIPESPAAAHLTDGDVIPQDRSSSAIELERVLDDVMPLLKSVQPQKLAETLGAVSGALDGRGEQLGDTLVRVSDYLGRFAPSLPNLKADIRGLAAVSDIYNGAAPDFLRAVSDLTTTSRTMVEKRKQLAGLYSSVTTVSDDLDGFLRLNKDNFIRLTATSQSTLDLLAKYAPQYPCMLKQLADSIPAAYAAFGVGTDQMNHVAIKFVTDQEKYRPGDEPEYRDKRGPRCYPQAPSPGRWPQYPPDGPVRDGASHPPASPGQNTPLPGDGVIQSGGPGQPASIANSTAERNLVDVLLTPTLGTSPDRVPGWASLLMAPLYRGAEVRDR